jgi:hypothetical protein
LYLLGTQTHILISTTISRSPVLLYLLGTQSLKYKTTGDLDIVDEIKICVWVPNKYNKTGDLDIVDEIKICDWVPNKYNNCIY